MQNLSARELADWLSDAASGKRAAPLVLDVREPWEVEKASVAGATAVPMQLIPQVQLPDSGPIVCLCHHGGRSMQVARYLEQKGRSDVYNLTGGIDAWSRDVDPTVPRY